MREGVSCYYVRVGKELLLFFVVIVFSLNFYVLDVVLGVDV